MTGENSFEISLEVIPNSKGFAVMGYSPWTDSIRVKVKAKALEGKANKELAEELGKMFSAKARIIAGQKSRNKKVLIEGAAKERFKEAMQSLRPLDSVAAKDQGDDYRWQRLT